MVEVTVLSLPLLDFSGITAGSSALFLAGPAAAEEAEEAAVEPPGAAALTRVLAAVVACRALVPVAAG
jgi:hypothetical protein